MSRKVALVNPEKCDGSPACMARRACPQKAISQKNGSSFLMKLFGGGTASVDTALCTGCGLCLKYCPHHAISMVKI